MKVFLINPDKFYEDHFNKFNLIKGTNHPIGLGYLAAQAEKNGHKVKILDMSVEPTSYQFFKKIFQEFSPDIVGIHLTLWTISCGVKLASYIKKEFKDIPILIGGPGLNSYPKEILNYQCFDYGLIGEADYTFLDFLNYISQKTKNKPRGFVYKEGEEVLINGSPSVVTSNLDLLPFPARHLFKGNYYNILGRSKPGTAMVTSRGCPFTCSFCAKIAGGNLARFRSAQNVIEEFKEIAEQGYREISLQDDSFTLDRKRVLDICTGLVKEKIRLNWSINTRIDSLDKEVLEALKMSGCYRLSVGVESGSERILELMGKKITKDVVRKNFNLIKKFKIEICSLFIIGFPGETMETMEETNNFIKEIKPDYCIFSIFCPLPDSPIFVSLPENSIVKTGWVDFIKLKRSYCPSYHGNLKKITVEKYRYKMLKSFYFQPRTIFNFLKIIKSFYRLKNYLRAAIFIYFSALMNKEYYKEIEV